MGNDSVNRGDDYITLQHQLPTDIESLNLLQPRVSCRPLIMEGFEYIAGPGFAHWVDAARARLLEQLTSSLNRDIDVQRTTGNMALVRERAKQLYDVNPGSLRAVSILAEQAAAEGNLTEGVRLIDTLITERELQRGHRDFDTLQGLKRRIERTRPARERTSGRSDAWRLVGRDAVLSRVYRAVTNPHPAGVRSILLTGPPGIGKTALMRHVSGATRADGHVCLDVTCSSDQIDFSVITECARQLMAHSELGATDPGWLGELAAFAPFLCAKYPGIPRRQGTEPPTLSATSGAMALNHAFETIHGGKPILLFLDGVDCLDRASKRVLRCLVEVVSSVDLVIMGARSDPPSTRARDVDTEPVDWCQIVPIGPLDKDCVGALISDTLADKCDKPEPAIIDRLTSWSNGVPLLLHALIRDLPKSDKNTLDARRPRHRLPSDHCWELSAETTADIDRHFHVFWKAALPLVEFLCLSEEPLHTERLATLSHRPIPEVDELLQLGLAMGILDVVGSRFTFSSPIFRVFVRNSMTAAHLRYRQAAMAGVGAVREQAGPVAARDSRVKETLAGAPPDDDALLLAGESAARSRDWGQLRSIARNASQMAAPPTSSRYLSLAFFSMTAGDYHRAVKRFQHCIIWLANANDTVNLARAYNGLGTSALALGRFVPAVNAFGNAFDLARTMDRRAFAGAIASNAGVACADFDFQRKAVRWFTVSMDLLGKEQALPYRATILANFIDHKLLMGDIPAATEIWKSAEAVMDECDSVSRGYLLCALADLLLAQQEVDRACEAITKAEQAFLVGSSIENHRFVMGFDSPHLARLSYFKALVKGSEEIRSMMERHWPTNTMPVTQQIELLAAFAWRNDTGRNVASRAIGCAGSKRVARMLERTGAVGVVKRLRTVGMLGKSLSTCVS
jgi:tetratricopeptide (TPR) repeat protein